MEEDELRRKSKRAAERTARSSALPALDITPSVDTSVKTETVPTAGIATAEVRPPADRSLTVAAGGRAALGGDPTIETLPEDTSTSASRPSIFSAFSIDSEFASSQPL